MAVNIVDGSRSTESILSARKVVDMGGLSELEDNKMLLTKLIQQMAKKPAHNSTFNWLTDELNPKTDQVDGAFLAGDTAIDVDNGAYFRINDLVVVPRTSEVMVVTNVVSNTLTVERSVGSTAAAALVDNDPLLILGPSYPEGSTLQSARSTKEVLQTNYTQIFRHPYHLTNTEVAMGKSGGLYPLPGGDDVTLQRTKKLIEHGRDINLSAYWNQSASGTSNPTQRATGGLYEYIPASNRDAVAVLTEAEFNDGLRSAFRYGAETKFLFCSRKFAGIINQYMADVQRVKPGESKYGVKMVEYTSPHGTLNIVTDHAIEGDEYDKFGFIVDLADLKYRFLPGRDTQLMLDRQATDEDGIKEEYLTECGFEWGEGRKHYVFNSVVS
jgi:hypothetical protein